MRKFRKQDEIIVAQSKIIEKLANILESFNSKS